MKDDNQARVLLVEPNNAIREWIADILTNAGFQIELSPQDGDPVAFAEQIRPQAIVAGIQVRTRSGSPLVDDLQKNPRTADIPVVLYRIPKRSGTAPATSNGSREILDLPRDFPILADAVARAIGEPPPSTPSSIP